jgi:acetylcholinesterase/cholinesterase
LLGGGWRQGHSDDPIYWGDFLANSTDTILVTLNYRLGIFGFIAFPPFFDTNVGITDQQIALEWVHTHIRSFGGDPTKITLAGQSAGAISVTIHMTSDKMIQKPLFNKAILHSNPMLLDFRTIEQSIPYTLEFASIIGCASGYRQAIVECILSKDAQDVLDAQEQVIWIPFPLSLKDDIPWQPVIDNDIIFEQPHQLIAKGHIMPNVSVIIGMVQNESTSFVYGPKPTPLDPLLYVGMLTAWFGQETTGKILKYYPSQLDSRNSLSQLVTDYFWTCSIRKAAQSLSQRVPTYLFVFEYSPIVDPLNNTTYCKHGRSCHGADLTYVFHSAKLAGYDFNSVQEEKLSRLMLGIWTNFAKDAKPWDLYDKSKEELAVFTEHGMDTKHKYHVDQCNLWDIIGEKSYNSVL